MRGILQMRANREPTINVQDLTQAAAPAAPGIAQNTIALVPGLQCLSYRPTGALLGVYNNGAIEPVPFAPGHQPVNWTDYFRIAHNRDYLMDLRTRMTAFSDIWIGHRTLTDFSLHNSESSSLHVHYANPLAPPALNGWRTAKLTQCYKRLDPLVFSTGYVASLLETLPPNLSPPGHAAGTAGPFFQLPLQFNTVADPNWPVPLEQYVFACLTPGMRGT